MSLDIDWTLLNSPTATHPDPLGSSLVSILNTQLASTSRPSFVGPITVTSFDFGSAGPSIEIKDVRDVWRAFDEDDDDPRSPHLPVPPEADGELEEEYDIVSPFETDEFEHGSVYSGFHGGGGGSIASAAGLGALNPSIWSRSGRPRRRYRYRPPSSPDPTSPAPLPPDKGRGIPSVQLHVHIAHSSDLSLTLLTSLQVNYPSQLFMSLPLKLSITGLTLSADLVVAYSSPKHRLHLTVIDEDPGDGNVGMRLLPDLKIESEIGYADAHVLRNVGKVEKFIGDVVRKTLVDELVFPNFHTIAL